MQLQYWDILGDKTQQETENIKERRSEL